MKLRSFQAFTLVFLLSAIVFSTAAQGERVKVLPRNPPPPKALSTVNEDADYQAKLLATRAEEEKWQEYSFPDDGFSADFPRTPVKSSKIFTDELFGKATLNMYTGIGDSGVFVIARMPLPYAINDPGVAKKFRDDAVKGFLEVQVLKIIDRKEIEIDGRTVLEIHAQREDNGASSVFRAFVAGKSFFYQLTVTIGGTESLPEVVAQRNAVVQADKDRFLDSISVSDIAAPVVPVNPLFASSFNDGLFRSDYFKFTIRPPEGWLRASEDDVLGMGQQSKGLIEANSTINVSKSGKERRNIFTFSIKPLGAEHNFMIAGNAIKNPSPQFTVQQFAPVFEKMMGGVNFYTVTRRSHPVTVGKNRFQSFDLKGRIGDVEFDQSVFLIIKRGYLLLFTATYDQETKALVMKSLESLTF